MDKLLDIISFKGKVKILESGLHIGGTEQLAGIGETDNPIIRHPITNEPYIPGSSVKGKIRSLLEMKYSPETQRTGDPCSCGICRICKLFGCGGTKNLITPTRLIFRDSYPDEKTKQMWSDSTDSEIKTEVRMNRKTGAAKNGGLRSTERIPGGCSFDFAFSIRRFEGDKEEKLLEYIAEGFELLEKDYLGGSGSRGYGQVAFFSENGKPMHDYLRSYSL